MDVNGPVQILKNLVVLGVMGGIIIFGTPITPQEVPGLVAANPLISAGGGLFVIVILLFGSGGSGHHHHHH